MSTSTTTPKKKPCCDCPETKFARDKCVMEHGEESENCKWLIQAHNICMDYIRRDDVVKQIESAPVKTPEKKICCSCPITKQFRDDCVTKYDTDSSKQHCKYLIDAHNMCLRDLGFTQVQLPKEL